MQIEQAGPPRLAEQQANTARLLVEAELPALRLSSLSAEAALPFAKAQLDAATQAKQAANQALAAKQADLAAAQAVVAALKAEVDALASEKQRLDAAKAGAAQASVKLPAVNP
jgi:chromosome segregation ATPase